MNQIIIPPFNDNLELDDLFAHKSPTGKIGFMARSLIQATLPHSKIAGKEFQRTNGSFTLTILAPSDIGLPYGSIPRLLMAWIATEAVKKNNAN